MSLISTSVFSRIVGPEEFGIYTLTLSVSMFGSMAAFQWLRFGVLRFISESPLGDAAEDIASVGRAFASITVGLVIIAGIATAVWRLPVAIVGLGLGIAVLQGRFDIGLTLARARQKTGAFGVASLTRALLYFLVGFVVAKTIGTGVGVLGVLALAYLAGIAILAPQWRSTARPTRMMIEKYWTFGWPATVAAGLLYACTAAERYIVNAVMGTASVGLYGAVFDVTSQLVLAGSIAVGLASFPILVAAHVEGGVPAVRERWRQVSFILGLVTTFAGSVFIGFRSELAAIMVGQEFRAAMGEVVGYVVVAAMLSGFKSYGLDPALHITRSTRTLMWIALLMFCTNVVCAFAFVPALGLRGAGLAAVITFGTGVMVTWLAARRTRLIAFPLGTLVGFLVAGAASVLILGEMPSGWRLEFMLLKAAVVGTLFGAVVLIAWRVARRQRQLRSVSQ